MSPSSTPLLLVLVLVIALAPTSVATQAPPGRGSTPLQTLSEAYETLVEQVAPSVVQVIATGYAGLGEGGDRGAAVLTTQRASGSGVIVDGRGFIVTNAHVVAGARHVEIVLPLPRATAAERRSIVKPPGRTVEATIAGLDRETDLAVLKSETTGLPALRFADSDELRQGQIVFAFGSPLGLQNSVTMGVVSAIGRQRAPDDPMVYLQTDAPINPGSSGGPLVDTDGRVVGINTFILSQSGGNEGLGFAAPSNVVRNVYEQIRTYGRVRRGRIGVLPQTITPALASGLALPVESGVILSDVEDGGPAASAGLARGDVLLTLDGKRMENARQLEVNVYRRRIGDVATVEYLRNGERKRTSIAVGERADDPERFVDLVDPERGAVPRLGILGVDLTPRLREQIAGLRADRGVIVAARTPDAAPGEQSLQAGDLIVSANGAPVTSISELQAQVARVGSRGPCVLQIQRGPVFLFVTLEVE
jgi:serine protease Do